MVIREPERNIEITRKVDVVVAGAGVSGCAAAVAAARTGAKTLLLERNGVLGGIATAGLMANIGNLFLDGASQPVIEGISREVVERMVARGGASAEWESREVSGVTVDTEILKVVLIEMAQEAGVEVFTHTMAARPIMDNDTVKGLFIESKGGREAVLSRVVVDATGDADVAWQTGCPMRWVNGSSSLEFKMGGFDGEALYQHFKRHPETFPIGIDRISGFEAFENNWVERGILFFPHGGGSKWDIITRAIQDGTFIREQEIFYHMDAVGLYGLKKYDTVIVNSIFYRLKSLHPGEISVAELGAQKMVHYVADFLKEHAPGFENAYIVQMANDLGIRNSRGIEGEATITREDHMKADHPVHFDDVIGRAPVRLDFDKAGDFLAPFTFDIPFGILLPKKVENFLIGSGKSASCKPQGVVAGMSLCMIVGQAAGTAASMAVQQNVSPRNVPIRDLQRRLMDDGVNLGKPERLASLGLA